MEPIFFEIPIYRCTKNAHTNWMEFEKQKGLQYIDKNATPESYNSISNHFDRNIWFPWKYNEIVGHLDLYIFGNQLRADQWFVSKKRINRGIIKKKFIYYGKILEINIPYSINSQEILNFIIEELNNLNKQEFRKYHLDLKQLKLLGPFINWKELAVNLNSFTFPETRNKYFEDQ